MQLQWQPCGTRRASEATVEAGAVRYAKDWPGAHTLPAHIGTRVIRVKRPAHYFDPNNPEWPEELELRLEMPVALLGGGAGAQRALSLGLRWALRPRSSPPTSVGSFV